VVLARGFVPCDVLFIAEAPGESEDIDGSVLVGPAGRLFDQILNTVLQVPDWRERGNHPRIGLTNLVACIPKEERHKGKISEPNKKHIEACGDRLREFYGMAKPKKVVCVGKLSEKWVPKILDVSIENTIGITHPAGILRMNIAQKGLAHQRVLIQLEDLFEELKEQQ